MKTLLSQEFKEYLKNFINGKRERPLLIYQEDCMDVMTDINEVENEINNQRQNGEILFSHGEYFSDPLDGHTKRIIDGELICKEQNPAAFEEFLLPGDSKGLSMFDASKDSKNFLYCYTAGRYGDTISARQLEYAKFLTTQCGKHQFVWITSNKQKELLVREGIETLFEVITITPDVNDWLQWAKTIQSDGFSCIDEMFIHFVEQYNDAIQYSYKNLFYHFNSTLRGTLERILFRSNPELWKGSISINTNSNGQEEKRIDWSKLGSSLDQVEDLTWYKWSFPYLKKIPNGEKLRDNNRLEYFKQWIKMAIAMDIECCVVVPKGEREKMVAEFNEFVNKND